MITSEEFLTFCDSAFEEWAGVLAELGDDLVSVRPDVPGANTAFGLTAHIGGVIDFWGRTTNRGMVVPRDRPAEFLATGTVAQALALLDQGRAHLHEDVAAADVSAAPANPSRTTWASVVKPGS